MSTYARIAPSWTNLNLRIRIWPRRWRPFGRRDGGHLAAGKMSGMTSMTAVVKAAAGPGAEIDQVEVPEPTGKDVLIEVAASSICGTDVHIFDWNEWAQRHIHPPRVFGHEMSGRIVATGPAGHDLKTR